MTRAFEQNESFDGVEVDVADWESASYVFLTRFNLPTAGAEGLIRSGHEWLVRRWSHLERQSGGIGLRGGPGETQIELDRRMIGERIKSVKDRLDKVKRQRSTQRKARERRGTFRVSLVGYTTAGKSTLFNSLVKARALAADQLFATLDTTTRALWLGDHDGAHAEHPERVVAGAVDRRVRAESAQQERRSQQAEHPVHQAHSR